VARKSSSPRGTPSTPRPIPDAPAASPTGSGAAEHVSTGTIAAVAGRREGRAFPAGSDMARFEALSTAIASDARG
jgi:hypothetical protein